MYMWGMSWDFGDSESHHQASVDGGQPTAGFQQNMIKIKPLGPLGLKKLDFLDLLAVDQKYRVCIYLKIPSW